MLLVGYLTIGLKALFLGYGISFSTGCFDCFNLN